MPPKRKRVDGEPEVTSTSATSTRATRSSGKAKEGTAKEPVVKKSTTKKPAATKSAKLVSVGSDEDEVKPVVKKVKTSKALPEKKSKVAKVKSKATDIEISDDELVNDDEAGPSKVASKKLKDDILKPYTPALALSLFNTYVDADTIGTNDPAIGPEGFEKLCNDAQIPLEGALPLVLAWILDAKEMAKIGKEEWVKGTGNLQISSLYSLGIAIRDVEALLLMDKPPIKRPTTNASTAKKTSAKPEKESYNRDLYWSYVADKKTAFLKLYGFCFALAKSAEARNIEMETATAFWSVLLAPRYPIILDVIAFINEKGSYKGANKDLWNMMLEFCQTVSPTLENFEADGAWPTLLDEFVAWHKAKITHAGAED